MRLISFLTEVEIALRAESAMAGGGEWEVSRMVNYHQGLARMVLTERTSPDRAEPRGGIFLQAFTLADGSLCLKATLSWQGSSEAPVMSVYSKPRMNWKAEAGMIASAWLGGPQSTVTATEEYPALAASA